MTDVVGNPEEERRAAFYHEPWSQEAVSRYFYCKVRIQSSALRSLKSPVPNLTGPLTDPAEETGAGTGLSCAHHLNPDPLNLSECVWRSGGAAASSPSPSLPPATLYSVNTSNNTTQTGC